MILRDCTGVHCILGGGLMIFEDLGGEKWKIVHEKATF